MEATWIRTKYGKLFGHAGRAGFIVPTGGDKLGKYAGIFYDGQDIVYGDLVSDVKFKLDERFQMENENG
jgi:hypothetical protein